MREHITGGCTECTRLAEFCRRLTHTCRKLADSEVPEAAVRRAHAIFPAPPPAPRRRAVRIPFELVFDSFLAPFPAGLRATWQVGWQGLYRAGECSLDLRIEPDLQSQRATLIGQISNHISPDVEISNAQVRLKNGPRVVAETISNRFGEFQVEYEQKGRLQLCVTIEDGARCLWVPVKKLVGRSLER